MIYLSTKYEKTLLGNTLEEKARLDILYQQLKDVKSAVTGPCYVGADPQLLAETAKHKMAPIVKALGKKEYIVGSSLTYLDFYMLEMCDFVQFLTQSEFYEYNKNIARYVKRIKGIR